ncbi:enoyl-CoA hydratase-related protein [Thalassobaculum sp.]|uniref:enoyl-CoA hydratase/isomerase family protein n=1 Tax=Thalassobaculum sp. TaxID=2022740 RepID=UPI0032EFF0A6
MDQTILYETRGPVALITLNRPDRLNALDQPMLDGLQAACDRAEADEAVGAVVLTGAGKAFSSGFDLQAQAAATPEGVDQWRPVLRRDFDAAMRFWHLSKPTVAAVHGPALAGACEMAMACDITVASEDAVFGEPELKFGAGIVVMLLPWIVGPKRAKEIILLGLDRIGAEEARAMGLVNRVVANGRDVEEALALARRMAGMDRVLVKETKRAINRTYDLMGMGAALEAALDIDTLIEGQGMPTKRRFLEIARADGLRAALAWREARAADSEEREAGGLEQGRGRPHLPGA